MPWSGDRQRRTIFFKYSPSLSLSLSVSVSVSLCLSLSCGLISPRSRYVPYGMHHVDRVYELTDPELTEQQRSRLQFPTQWFNKPGRGSPFYVDAGGEARL